jgi:DNA polymerase-4
LTQSTAQTNTILAAARALLTASVPLIERQGLTLIAVAVGNVQDSDALQLALPFDKNTNDALDVALDRVNDRFGAATVTRAVLLGRQRGDAPMLPD